MERSPRLRRGDSEGQAGHAGDAKAAVLVTGGAGFIGSHLVARLLRSAREVTVLDLPGRRVSGLPAGAAGRVRYVEGDVRDEQIVASALRGAQVVYHLAALQPGGKNGVPDADVFSTNVVGTFNVLSAGLRSGVRRVLFTSTYEVYGEPADLPVDESHPLLAMSCYAASKAAAEVECRAFRREHGLDTVVLRLADVYGSEDAAGPVGSWVARARAGQNLEVLGDRTSDFIWVNDAVEALVRAGAMDGTAPTINVGSGTGARHADVARRIVAAAGSRSHVRILPASELKPVRYVSDVRRMRQVLRIEPALDPLAHLEDLLAPPAVPAAPTGSAPRLSLGAGMLVN
jgi:nucleoside-diphosphate-sugar epimerase